MSLPPPNADFQDEPQNAEEALRALLVFRPYIMAFIFSMVRDFESTERVYQDICIAVGREWAHKSKIDFKTWARELARRHTLAFLRARADSNQVMPPPELVQEIENAVSEKMTSLEFRWAQRKEALRTALKTLPSQLRQVIELGYLENLPIHEIAHRLGENQERIRTRLLQARTELQTCLNQQSGGLT